jgi:hypothetical protein
MLSTRSRSWLAAGALALPLAAAACAADATATDSTALAATTPAGPSTVAHGDWVISDFALDATSAYVSIASATGGAPDTGEILAVKKDGTHARTLAAQQKTPTSITVGAIHVYWMTDSMFEVVKTGGAPTLLATGVHGSRLTVHGNALYYLDGSQQSIVAVPTSGGAPTSIASGPNLRDLALDKSHVYFTSCRTCNGAILADTLGTNKIQTLADGLCCPFGIAVDATEVYWSEATDSAIVKEPVAGGTPTKVAGVAGAPEAIAIDGVNVYWVAEDGTISKAPKAGGAPTQLASGAYSDGRIAVDGTSVYFISADQKSLLKIAK